VSFSNIIWRYLGMKFSSAIRHSRAYLRQLFLYYFLIFFLLAALFIFLFWKGKNLWLTYSPRWGVQIADWIYNLF
jgi:cell division protein FtsB